jgi:hypothetical protein
MTLPSTRPTYVTPTAAVFILALSTQATPARAADDSTAKARPAATQRVDGYRGIWWGQEPTYDRFSYKYSGGLATYTAKHIPLAIYAKPANKTFFVYGGTNAQRKNRLVAMIGYFDHATGTVPRPLLVYDKETSDPHDNPSLMIDDAGTLWVFISGRGRGRPGRIYRSRAPYSIDAFDEIEVSEFTYPQPWNVPGHGTVFLFTKYLGGRQLFWRTGTPGDWSDDQHLAAFGGHYQLSREHDGRVATAFNYHPGGNVDKRTNLYYAETRDAGKTWQTVRGETLALPLTDVKNPALIYDAEAKGKLVYLNDLNFDPAGRPVIQYVESNGWRPGPANGPRVWKVAHWTGEAWAHHAVCESDHNYDTGALYIEGDLWRIIGPTEPGPERWHTGGEIALWESPDAGKTWHKSRQLTRDSRFNHTYVRRPVNAHPDFYAYWADGDASKFSDCRLYFTNRDCNTVWVLPQRMTGETAKPVVYHGPGDPLREWDQPQKNRAKGSKG